MPSKAGYRTLLSLQLLQKPLTSYLQHGKEKSSKKSHRFDRYCFLIRASGDAERGKGAREAEPARETWGRAQDGEKEWRCSER